MSVLAIARTTGTDPDFVALAATLDDELWQRYGDVQATYDPFNATPPPNVVIARRAGVAIGCGGLAPHDATTAELKRLFVLTTERGSGVATAVLRELEVWARELHYTAIILETGARQPEALGLYAARGYERIAPYGAYAALPTSICMRKLLL